MEKQEMKGFYPETDPNDVAPASGLNGEGRTEILHTPTTGFTGRIYRGSVIPNVNQIPATAPDFSETGKVLDNPANNDLKTEP